MGVVSDGPVVISNTDGDPLIGQHTMAGSIPVVLPSDQTISVTANSSAEATAAAPSYVEGTENPLSQNLSGDLRVIAKQSTSPWVVSGTVAVSNFPATQPVSGTVTAVQSTAASLNATVVGTGTFAVQATQSGTWNVTVNTALPAGSNTIGAVTGPTASGSSLTASPLTIGGLALTALPTAVATTQVVNAMMDKFGRGVNLPITIRDLAATQTTTLSATTSETTIITQAANVFNDIIALIVINTSAGTNTRIDFRDTTAGSVIFALQSIGGGGPTGFVFPVPLPQTTVNTNWTAQCATSTTDIRILAFYAKNK